MAMDTPEFPLPFPHRSRDPGGDVVIVSLVDLGQLMMQWPGGAPNRERVNVGDFSPVELWDITDVTWYNYS